MSYNQNDIKTGFVPLKSMVAEWQALDRELLSQVETEEDRKLYKKCQDDCISDLDRQKRIKAKAAKHCDFIHTLSYNRAIGYISRTEEKQLYNGSTYNRKPAEKKDKYSEIFIDEYAEIQHDYDTYRANKGIQFYQFDSIGSKISSFQIAPGKKKRDNSKHSTSKRTKDKIKEKMLALYRASSGKAGYRKGVVNFTLCTLTFVCPVDDNEGQDCLNKFLTVLRERYGKFSYIWVAERQTTGYNGSTPTNNIHFHMIADCRFPIGYINSLWVSQQYNSGIRNWESDAELYEDHRTNFANLHTEGKYHLVQDYLNPVDIRAVKTIDGVSCYLTNYVTKNTGSFDCLAWHCSRRVSRIFTNKIIDKKIFDYTGNAKRNCIVSKKTGQLYENETYHGEYCTINNIYNKTYYRRYLNDMEEINKYILNLENEIQPEMIRKYIKVDNQEYRQQFLKDCEIQKN